MCGPSSIALASLALAAGGTAYGVSENISAKNQANQANEDAARRSAAARIAEQARQKELSDQAWAQWQAQLGKVDAQAQTQAQEQGTQLAADTAQRVSAAEGVDMGQLPGSERAAPEAKEDVARRTATIASRARQQAAAMAQMSGYGAAQFNTGLANQRFATALTSLNNTRQASLGVSRLEGSTVPMVPGMPSPLAGAMLGFGQLGLQYAGSKGAGSTIFGTTPTTPKATS